MTKQQSPKPMRARTVGGLIKILQQYDAKTELRYDVYVSSAVVSTGKLFAVVSRGSVDIYYPFIEDEHPQLEQEETVHYIGNSDHLRSKCMEFIEWLTGTEWNHSERLRLAVCNRFRKIFDVEEEDEHPKQQEIPTWKVSEERKMESIGEKIRKQRKKLGLTIDQLALRAESSKSFLWDLENNNTKPSFEKMEKIANSLGVSIVHFSSEDKGFPESSAPCTIQRATVGSAGYDLVAQYDTNYDDKPFYVDVGPCPKIPEGYFGLLCPRSSLTAKGIVFHGGNHVIDSDYSGDVKVALATSWEVYSSEKKGTCDRLDGGSIARGERIAQLVLIPYGTFPGEMQPIEERTGGFGSTGR